MMSLGSGPAYSQQQLTVEDVQRLAVEFNRTYLQAQEDVTIARAEITRAFADVLPDLSLQGSYNRSFRIPSVFFEVSDMAGNSETVEFKTGFKNAFDVGVSLRQPIWHGGKTFAAYAISKLYRDYSEAIAQQVEDEVVLAATELFNAAILAEARLAVQQQALESNSANLEVAEKKYDQGMVSEFEVLRARVEKQNILPEILAAESQVRLTRKRLKSFIGLDLEAPVTLIESQSDTSLAGLPSLQQCIDSALARRPEVVQAEKLTRITDKAIRVAQGDYWPELDAVAGYNWNAVSDDFTLSENNSTSWTAGLTLSFNIFDGGARKGDVNTRKAERRQAELALKQTIDDVTLEVEEAYDLMLQAKQALDIQGATIASAEEGLKIAQVRYESGVGTQLEVLSAQTALTRAREILAQAIYAFRQSRAGLERATTLKLGMK